MDLVGEAVVGTGWYVLGLTDKGIWGNERGYKLVNTTDALKRTLRVLAGGKTIEIL